MKDVIKEYFIENKLNKYFDLKHIERCGYDPISGWAEWKSFFVPLLDNNYFRCLFEIIFTGAWLGW